MNCHVALLFQGTSSPIPSAIFRSVVETWPGSDLGAVLLFAPTFAEPASTGMLRRFLCAIVGGWRSSIIAGAQNACMQLYLDSQLTRLPQACGSSRLARCPTTGQECQILPLQAMDILKSPPRTIFETWAVESLFAVRGHLVSLAGCRYAPLQVWPEQLA